MKSKVQTLLLVSALAAAFQVQAQDSTLQVVRQKWAELAGRSDNDRNKPVEATRQNDSWGDEAPLPARGLRREQRVDERRIDDRGYDDRPVPKSRPSSDERAVVRRHADEAGPGVSYTRESSRENSTELRQGSNRTTAAGARNVAEVEPRPAAAPRAKPRSEVEDRLERLERLLAGDGGRRASVAVEPAPTAAAGGGFVRVACVNVSRVWEGAAVMAQRGQEDRAYETYLKLLSTCTDEKELEGTVWQAQKNLGPEFTQRLLDEPVMSSPKLEGAWYALSLQRMYAANKAQDAKLALSIARSLRPLMATRQDAGALTLAGWLEQRVRNYKDAESAFRLAIRADRDGMSQREGLVVALLALGKTPQAAAEVERIDSENAAGLRAEVKVAQARDAYKAEDGPAALKLLAEAEQLGVEIDSSFLSLRAWALRMDKKPEQAARLFERLVQSNPQNEEFKRGMVESYVSAKDYEALERVSSQAGVVGTKAREALTSRLVAQGRRSEAARALGQSAEGLEGGVTAGAAVRSKSGDAGEGKLTAVAMPAVALSKKLSATSRVEVEGVALKLDDGNNTAEGRELRMRYVRDGDTRITAGAGVSQVNGSTEVTAELKVRQHLESGYVEAGIVREPVMDSVRAYGGIKVQRPLPLQPGQTEPLMETVTVGRAMRTGLTAAGQHPYGDMRLEWELGAGSVAGTNISRNSYMDLRAAVMKDFSHPSFSWLSIGPELRLAQWSRDENRFGTGFGGYFSPKSNTELGMKLNALTFEGGRSLYKASGYLGYVSRGLSYGSEAGLGAEADLSAGWLISPHLIAKAGLSFRTAPGYTDTSAFFGLQIPFERRSKLYSSDIAPIKLGTQ